MKHFVTLVACLVSLFALGQNPNYDPDSNGDDFIGSADLVSFLTLFNTMLNSETLTVGYAIELDSAGTFELPNTSTPVTYYSVPDSVDVLLYSPTADTVQIEPYSYRYVVLRSTERQRLVVADGPGGSMSYGDSLVPCYYHPDFWGLSTWLFFEDRWFAL